MVFTPGRQTRHCKYCGARFAPSADWPRDCPSCGETTWANPLPVAVTLLPVLEAAGTGLLVVCRTIPPCIGEWTLPGGYMEIGETWRQAAVRELREESGVEADSDEAALFDVDNGPDTLQVFASFPPRTPDQLPPSRPTEEASGWAVLRDPAGLAFDTQVRVARRFFAAAKV